jgi:release factor glutamine methyltransferase
MMPATEQPWTLGRLLEWTTRHLAERGSEFPRLDAEVLLAQAQGCRRIELYTRFDEIATDDVRTKFRELVRRRSEGCPVAYLVGKKEFFSLEFDVTPAVLIPRPDTETVVMTVLDLAKGMGSPSIADVGAGSGNIAVTLAKHLPSATIIAIDLSPESLEVAKRNAARHGVSDRIEFLQGDLLGSLSADRVFDFIVSNPPYIATEDIPKLPVGVRQYEPLRALDGGPGGYAVIRRLLEQAPAHLRPGGYLVVEIGVPQETEVRRLIEQQPELQIRPTLRDYSGHPRVVTARHRS